MSGVSMCRNGRIARLIAGLMISASSFGAANAQDAANESGAADDTGSIVVTAQRRSELMQNVPVTISALAGATAQNRGVRELVDLNIAVPGLNVTRQVGSPLIYMRGVGNNNNTAGQEQNIAVYVDGVYYPSIAADLGAFNSIERIEVLKGPQGTLFGRNTTGGLIQVVTKDPTQELGGTLRVGYGNYNTLEGSGYVTGGLATNLAADLSVNYRRQATGWGREVITGRQVSKSRSIDLRSKIVFQPSEATKLTVIGAHSFSKGDLGDASHVLSRRPLPAAWANSVFPGNIYDSTNNEMSGSTIKQTSASLRLDQGIGDLDLMLLSAYQDTLRKTFLDLDKSGGSVTAADFPDHTRSFSQEVQLSSPGDGKLKWIVGGMYFWANASEDPLAIYAGPTKARVAAYFTGQKANSLSAYGQATYAVTDATNVTIGGRYTYDRKELYGSLFAGPFTISPSDATRKRNFKNFTYKFGIDHHFAPDVMAYASVSTGFKSGVYNITFAGPNDLPVRPEKLRAYEVGLKSKLADNVRFNLSGFYYDYKDIQLQTFVGTAILLLNAAAGEVYGAEAELEARLLPGLRFNAAATLMNSKYKDFRNAPSYDVSATGIGVPISIDATGNKLLRTPNFTGNVSLDYSTDTSIGRIGANVTAYHNSGFFWELDNRLRQKAYTTVNTQLSWRPLDSGVEVKLWARNLFNVAYYASQVSGSNAPDGGTPAPPRTYGASVGFSF